MKFKASVDYGVRAVLYLAVKGDTCSSREISEEMAVPRDYLIQLALRLRNYGLIKARPGKNGGYVLARPASEITVADILNAFDSDLKHVRVPMKSSRNASDSANTVRFLHGTVVESLESYLNAISLTARNNGCLRSRPIKTFRHGAPGPLFHESQYGLFS